MPPEFQGPFSEQQYELYSSELSESASGASQQRKIDPMGMMGKIFSSIGAVLIVIGVLIAVLLGFFDPRGFIFFFAVTAGAWGAGLIFLLVGLAFLKFFRNVRSAIVVDDYLMALANQDYPAAFQYLDPWMMTRQNDVDAQTDFTRRAQAYDEQGSISDYALRQFKLNPTSARYTIKMRRGAHPYLIHLVLAKRGDAWKITAFDRF